jgi:hypothetical protein
MYPPEVIQALKEALRNIYWYKGDLRLFFKACDIPDDIIVRQAWDDPKEYKIRIVGALLDELISMGEAGLGPIRRLIRGVLEIQSFDHLRILEDGPTKVSEARKSVEALRALALAHDETLRKETIGREDQQYKVAEALKRRNQEIERLRSRFFELVAEASPQRRGILFQEFLYDLFSAHDLNPRGSFKIVGEQIDGAFEFEGTQFLLEAKWEKNPIGAAPIDSFTRKVERKLENTLGFFIALHGYTSEGLTAIRATKPSVVLMDGEDLAVVLQSLVDFRDLLKRKIRHAAQTGEPFLPVHDL